MRGEISRSSGIPLELFLPRRLWKHFAGHSNQMGTVKTEEIGQPACQPSKSAMIAHDGASETERISVDDEGLTTPSRRKVQSLLVGNEQSTRCIQQLDIYPTNPSTVHYVFRILRFLPQMCKITIHYIFEMV